MRIMAKTDVKEIRAAMDAAKTAKNARHALARMALSRDNLTACGREEWQDELAASSARKPSATPT